MVQENKIEPNYIEKAIVPYIPIEVRKKSCSITALIYSAYKNRFKYYYIFFAFAAVISVVAFKLHSLYPFLANNCLDKFFGDYESFGYSVAFLLRNFFLQGLTVSFAFLAGFTVFALPISVLCFSHVFLSAFFLFAKLPEISDFYIGFAVVLLFSLLFFVSVIFFTETAIAYGNLNKEDNNKAFCKYILSYFLYLIAVTVVLYFGFELTAAYRNGAI